MIPNQFIKVRRLHIAPITSFFKHFSSDQSTPKPFSIKHPNEKKIVKNEPNPQFQTEKVTAVIEYASKELSLRPPELLAAFKETPDLASFSVEQWRTCFGHLEQYGFFPKGILKMVKDYPGLLKFEENELEDSVHNWMSCMFGEENLIPLLIDNPYFLNVDHKTLNFRIPRLREYLEGRRKRVLRLLTNCPQVMFKNWEQLENVMEYMTEPMRIPKSQIARSGVFRYDLFHLRVRFLFLYRAGVYIIRKYNADPLETPRHPPLTDIVDTTDEKFTYKVAKLSLPEFFFFRDLLYFQDTEPESSDDEIENTYGLINKWVVTNEAVTKFPPLKRRPPPMPPVVE